MTSLSGLKMMDMVLLWMILSPAMEVRSQWEVDLEEELTTGDQDKILYRTGQIEDPWTDQHLLLLVLIASGWLNNIIMITLESMSHNSIMSGEYSQQPGNWPAPINYQILQSSCTEEWRNVFRQCLTQHDWFFRTTLNIVAADLSQQC